MNLSNELIPLIDLGAQRRRLGGAVDRAVLNVLDHGSYIMGPEVAYLEEKLAAFCGVKHAISCASGTDALTLVLMAKKVGPGQAVICPSFTFAATAEVVARAGATPVFADVNEDTFNLDPVSVEFAITRARELSLEPVGVISVDLFGQPAEYQLLEAICEREGMFLLADAAQSFGATYRGRKVGAIGDASSTSFFPSKPLGCYGDGGAVFTNNSGLAEVIRSIRVHGQGSDKYENVRIGMNGRLDTMQAAILLEKLKIFDDEVISREFVACRYDGALKDYASVPARVPNTQSVWAHYTIKIAAEKRNGFRYALAQLGISTAIYYITPLHQQLAYRHYPVAGTGLPVSERLSREVISLPMSPYLNEDNQSRVIEAALHALS